MASLERSFSLSPFKMCTVDYAKLEIEMHKVEILRKSKLDEQSLNYLIEIITLGAQRVTNTPTFRSGMK
jgi:hypothetical protein